MDTNTRMDAVSLLVVCEQKLSAILTVADEDDGPELDAAIGALTSAYASTKRARTLIEESIMG